MYRCGVMVLFAVFAGCGVGSDQDGIVTDPLRVAPAGALSAGGGSAAQAPVMIPSATVEGDTLRIQVQYAGGCGQHRFGLWWDGQTLESAPPQVVLRLTHDDGGDACEAALQRVLSFRLDAPPLPRPARIRLEGYPSLLTFP